MLERLCRLATRAGVALNGFEEVRGFEAYGEPAAVQAREVVEARARQEAQAKREAAETEKAAEKARKQAEAEAAWLKSEPTRCELQEAVAARMAAWHAGDGAAASDKEREAQERLVVSEAIAACDDFRELAALGDGCAIEKTEERAISLAQLRHLEGRAARTRGGGAVRHRQVCDRM